jgi:hypothetical protein
MKRAMITIEVLIALLILFLSIMISMGAFKFVQQVKYKQENIQRLYMTVINIRNKIKKELCGVPVIKGEFDGFKYTAQCTLLRESRTYMNSYDFDTMKDTSGLNGPFIARIYKIRLEVKNKKIYKTYQYYIMKVKETR